MSAEPDRPPNMLAAAILASVLGLASYAKFRGEPAGTDAVLLGVMLLAGGAAAYGRHKALLAMTPEARARYWARKDAEWRATADAHARSVLGRDYDKK